MKKDYKLQVFTTVLAYTLPVLQFLFTLLNAEQQKIFLFQKDLLVVSIVGAVLSYLIILLLKTFPYFQYVPFQSKRKTAIREWNQNTNRFVNNFSKAEVKKYLKDNVEPAQPFVLNSENVVPRILIPLFVISFLSFLVLGSIPESFRNAFLQWTIVLSVIQAINYLALICSAVASFTLFYYRNKSQRDYSINQTSTYERALSLARRNNSFNELRSTRLIAQKEMRANPVNPLSVFLMQVGDKFYILATNPDITKVELCVEYIQLDEAYSGYNGLGA